MRLLASFLALIALSGTTVKAQSVDHAAAGVQLCDCLPPEDYLLLKKTITIDGQASVEFHANVESVITFLTAYGHIGGHALNLNWPNDLVVGSADLTALLTGFNHYPPFEETLCAWEVMTVASHGWILALSDSDVFTEAYVHESTFDEFDLGPETYGQCGLNSFDLEMVHLPDSVVRLSFVRKFQDNPPTD